jgi:RNA polymerase sigma factor (sigma-70 family)
MARPLDKIAKGKRLVRDPAIEAAIDLALGQSVETIFTRAAIYDKNSPEYLPSECFVHLIRHARRNSNSQAPDLLVPNVLLRVLLKRCEKNLSFTVSSSIATAADLREEILSEFSALFALDGSAQDKHRLDFYEVRFNKAFKLFRITRVSRELDRLNRNAPRPASLQKSPDGTEADVTPSDPADEIAENMNLEDSVFRKQMMNAIRTLPPEERKAVILCKVLGYKVESTDPDEITAAKLCGVSGRTIRTWLSRAIAKLEKIKEVA